MVLQTVLEVRSSLCKEDEVEILKKSLKSCRTFNRIYRRAVNCGKVKLAKMTKVESKRILIFSRLKIDNYGDPIIADCCRYLIEKVAREEGIPVETAIADIYEPDEKVLRYQLERRDAVVFPGGGMNGPGVNRIVIKILDILEETGQADVFFNAVGISRKNVNKRNVKLLKKIFNRPQVKQITTRGSIKKLKRYLTAEKPYPPKLVLDAAMWVNEAYGVEKKKGAEVIGIGVIRPEIFGLLGWDISVDDVFRIYIDIIRELKRRGYQWQLFTNGSKQDYCFGELLLERMGLEKEQYMGENVASGQALVEKIAGYRAVIAARLHANIIATSLNIPSVGLVWNDKMNMFAGTVGCEERYISGETLFDAEYVVNQMEQAIRNGYDREKIDKMKKRTILTIKNIVAWAREEGDRR